VNVITPVVTKADVDGEENGGENDADGGENTHDDVDDDTDRQQLVNSTISRRTHACTQPCHARTNNMLQRCKQ